MNKVSPLSTTAIEHANVMLAFAVSIAFSALFSSDNVAIFLVKAVFNGLGLVMVTGLLSLLIGNLITLSKHHKSFVRNTQIAWGIILAICLATIAALVLVKKL